jgi:NTE family protein
MGKPTPPGVSNVVSRRSRWDAGYAHTRSVLERKPWVGEFDPLAGVVLHEHMEEMPIAAE